MASIIRPTTPPPPSRLHTPDTPRYGWADDYQPYSPRKSARVSSQRLRAAETPPPQSSGHDLRTSHSSPRSSKKVASTNRASSASLPRSPHTASKRTVTKNASVAERRTVSGSLDYYSTASAAEALGLPTPQNRGKMEGRVSSTITRDNGMLPTPTKTPKKRSSDSASGLTSIARNLFPIRAETAEEAMPSPKKRGRKKYSGFTLDNFGDEEDEPASIQIYTDSQDRVPEVDLSSSNPFYGESSTVTQTEPTKRTRGQRRIPVEGEPGQTVVEGEHREDGIIVVFRGKKMFRRFAVEDHGEVGEPDGEIDAQMGRTVPASPRGGLRRSSIKPRLLFPTSEQVRARERRSQVTEDEEEAVTDIEESDTPMMQMDGAAETPRAPKFAPVSPPTTTRATRSGNKADMSRSPIGPTSEDEPAQSPVNRGRGRGGKVSPFDKWQRTKSGAMSQSKKRQGEHIPRNSGDITKRLRG